MDEPGNPAAPFTRSEVLSVYEIVLDEIQSAKNWGTQLTYWTIAAQGGVLVLAGQQTHIEGFPGIALAFICFLVTAQAAFLLFKNGQSLNQARTPKGRVLN